MQDEVVLLSAKAKLASIKTGSGLTGIILERMYCNYHFSEKIYHFPKGKYPHPEVNYPWREDEILIDNQRDVKIV